MEILIKYFGRVSTKNTHRNVVFSKSISMSTDIYQLSAPNVLLFSTRVTYFS